LAHGSVAPTEALNLDPAGLSVALNEGGAARDLLALSAPDPEALLPVLLATGLAPQAAWAELWGLGDPGCRSWAVQQGAAWLREHARQEIEQLKPHAFRTHRSSLEWRVSELFEACPDLGNAILEACEGLLVGQSWTFGKDPRPYGNPTAPLPVAQHLTALPVGLRVEGGLTLEGCERLAQLPAGLAIQDDLCLRRSGITALPPRLSVGGNLLLEGCGPWDGRIPEDADIRGRICTDAFPFNAFHRFTCGLSLAEWRERNRGGWTWRP
jgi:hypothetical protein